jgi:hypothetical protein
MRIDSLKTLDLILSPSKDEAKISGFFSSLPAPLHRQRRRRAEARLLAPFPWQLLLLASSRFCGREPFARLHHS